MKLSKLLLVEDNKEAADLIITILEYVGHKVIHKATASEGLQAVQSDDFDGILLDYMLPDMHGIDLCRMIRQRSIDVPVILTSAHPEQLSEEELFDAGVTAFVPKPISQNIVHTVGKFVRTQSMIQVEFKEPTNWVKRVLGPYYAD
jgi:CheY-like chemotaxis protein